MAQWSRPQREGILVVLWDWILMRGGWKAQGFSRLVGAGRIRQDKGQMGALGLLKPISAFFGPELLCWSLVLSVPLHPLPTTPNLTTEPQGPPGHGSL